LTVIYFGAPQDVARYCSKSNEIGWAYVGSDVATDFITILLPVPMVRRRVLPFPHHKLTKVEIFKLQLMSTARKVGLIALFSVGLL
jgi:hypothetical protein